MFGNLSEQTTVLVFRLSISVLIGSINLLACFIGKFIKENSIIHYFYFHTGCCGILLAKGFADIFILQEINSITAALLFSSTFLFLYAAKTLFIPNSPYEYNQVSNFELDINEDDEDLGIEISDHVPNILRRDQDRLESGEYDGEIGFPTDQESTQQEKLSLLWFLSVVVAVIGNEISKGVVLGSEQHATIFSYEQVLVDGCLQAFAYGVVCEEALTTSTSYLLAVLVYILSKPIGVILGNFLVHKQITVACEWIALFTSGVYLAFVVFHMIPTNDRLINSHSNASNTTKQEKSYSTIVRASAFVIGYLLTFLIEFI